MRLGIISDVHANIQALQAVAQFLKGEIVDQVLVVGDLVGYGANPGPVIDFVREQEGWMVCMGSSDLRVALPVGGQVRAGVAEQVIQWTRGVLSDEQRDYLRGLPVGSRIKTPQGRLRFFHGMPTDPEQKLNISGPEAPLAVMAAQFPACLLVCAGTHVPYLRRVGTTTFLDPGSVGLTLNGEPGADVAVVDIERDREIKVRLHKVPYDIASAAFDVLAWELPEEIAQVLENGRN